MKNDWETHWLPSMTLGIIRMTSLWLDQKNLLISLLEVHETMAPLPLGKAEQYMEGEGKKRPAERLVLCKSISLSPVAAA